MVSGRRACVSHAFPWSDSNRRLPRPPSIFEKILYLCDGLQRALFGLPLLPLCSGEGSDGSEEISCAQRRRKAFLGGKRSRKQQLS
jgi:hypothetical protein